MTGDEVSSPIGPRKVTCSNWLLRNHHDDAFSFLEELRFVEVHGEPEKDDVLSETQQWDCRLMLCANLTSNAARGSISEDNGAEVDHLNRDGSTGCDITRQTGLLGELSRATPDSLPEGSILLNGMNNLTWRRCHVWGRYCLFCIRSLVWSEAVNS